MLRLTLRIVGWVAVTVLSVVAIMALIMTGATAGPAGQLSSAQLLPFIVFLVSAASGFLVYRVLPRAGGADAAPASRPGATEVWLADTAIATDRRSRGRLFGLLVLVVDRKSVV